MSTSTSRYSPCDVGLKTNSAEKCHKKNSAIRSAGLKAFDTLQDVDRDYVLWRANIRNTSTSIETICVYHEKTFLDHYRHKQTHCCNIFQKHKKKCKASARHYISLDTANEMEVKGFQAVPGYAWCSNCSKHWHDIKDGWQETNDELECMEDDLQNENDDCEWEPDADNDNDLNSSLASIGISPFKSLHGLDARKKVKICQEKMNKAKRRICEVSNKVCSLTDIDGSLDSVLGPEDEKQLQHDNAQMKTELNEYHEQLDSLKIKFQDPHTSYNEKNSNTYSDAKVMEL